MSWRIRLNESECSIRYKKGSENLNTDCLSRIRILNNNTDAHINYINTKHLQEMYVCADTSSIARALEYAHNNTQSRIASVFKLSTDLCIENSSLMMNMTVKVSVPEIIEKAHDKD